MRVKLCQLRPTLGDVKANLDMAMAEIKKEDYDIICFSELFLYGYPPTDDLFDEAVEKQINGSLYTLIEFSRQSLGLIIMGLPILVDNHWRNAAVAIANGQIIHRHDKCCLPNHDVFCDSRYFLPGREAISFEWRNQRIALLICEDIWVNKYTQYYDMDPVMALNNQPLSLIIHLSASPYQQGKNLQRYQQLKRLTSLTGAKVISLNQVGAYAELIFDGQSMAMDETGDWGVRLPAFEPCCQTILLGSLSMNKTLRLRDEPKKNDLIQALTFGIKQYVENAHEKGVIVGVSGGIDSAVVASLAVLALGAKQVTLVSMPTQYNSIDTKADAATLAQRLDTPFIEHDIDPLRVQFEADISALASSLDPITKQNIQARIRGLMLMGVSNQRGQLLLTTGNKSELAMGYATLYGDMCGALNPIGDLFKTEVFELAKLINTSFDWIPKGIISRAPSAELAFDQRDDDVLPPYERLDKILIEKIIKGYSSEQLMNLNDKKDVINVLNRLKKYEFKRAQSPPILKVSSKAFGGGWQYPIIQ